MKDIVDDIDEDFIPLGFTRVFATVFDMDEKQGIEELAFRHQREMKLCIRDTVYALPT